MFDKFWMKSAQVKCDAILVISSCESLFDFLMNDWMHIVPTTTGRQNCLPSFFGVTGSADIFQEKMSELMCAVEFVRVSINYLLIPAEDTFKDQAASAQNESGAAKTPKSRIESQH